MREQLKEHLRRKLFENILNEEQDVDVDLDAPSSPVPPYMRPDIYFPAYNPFPYGFPGMGTTPHGWNFERWAQDIIRKYGYWPFGNWDPMYSQDQTPYIPPPRLR